MLRENGLCVYMCVCAHMCTWGTEGRRGEAVTKRQSPFILPTQRHRGQAQLPEPTKTILTAEQLLLYQPEVVAGRNS